MTDTKLLRHSLDSAAPLKPQLRRAFGGPSGGCDTRQQAPSARRPPPPRSAALSFLAPPGSPADPKISEKTYAKCGDAEKSDFPRASPGVIPSRSPPAAPGEGQPWPRLHPRRPRAGEDSRGGFTDPRGPLHAPFLGFPSYLSAERRQRLLPACKRITFPLDLNFLVLTVQEKWVISA